MLILGRIEIEAHSSASADATVGFALFRHVVGAAAVAVDHGVGASLQLQHGVAGTGDFVALGVAAPTGGAGFWTAGNDAVDQVDVDVRVVIDAVDIVSAEPAGDGRGFANIAESDSTLVEVGDLAGGIADGPDEMVVELLKIKLQVRHS